MGDAGNHQPSKKRAAGVQLSRDNPGLDDNEETCEQETGTFKKASDEVLATRRIVKVRRQQTPSAPPASNPFAAIQLAPPVSSPDNSKLENKADEPKVESNAEKEKTDAVDDNADKQSESKDVDSKAELNAETDETNVAKDANNEEKDDRNKNVEESAQKNSETASFSSFQQLSSGQNAFSGITGTGFSSTSFSFGSLSKDGSSNSIFGGFGGSTNENSSVANNTTVSNSEGSKFPPMQEVSVETGEEKEKSVFSADSILFEFIDGGWKERGKGEVKVNVSTTGTGKARLVMRARGNYRLILNASLFPDMKLTGMEKKGITFACFNSAGEGKDGLSTIALKFKDPSFVNDFRTAVMEHKGKIGFDLKTPENSPKASDE